MSDAASQSDLSVGTEDREGGRALVLGTAGHIDHGKTSLVKALTGSDLDRAASEADLLAAQAAKSSLSRVLGSTGLYLMASV